MKNCYAFFFAFCVMGVSSSMVSGMLRKTASSVKSGSKTPTKTLRSGLKTSTKTAPIATSFLSTSSPGATVSGATLSSVNLNPVGALNNTTSTTTGNTKIRLDGSAFATGATVAVSSDNFVQGASQSISSVLGGSNSVTAAGYSGNGFSGASKTVSALNNGPVSGISNSLNQTNADFDFHMNGSDLGGGVGSLQLLNGSKVLGGVTTSGGVGGTDNIVSVSA
jgi:hypothetical protein